MISLSSENLVTGISLLTGSYLLYKLFDRVISKVINPTSNQIVNKCILFTNVAISTTLSSYSLNYLENKCPNDKSIIKEFTILFILTRIAYPITNNLLNKYVPEYRSITPDHKKMYVVKNFIKSFFLAGLCCIVPFKIISVISGNYDVYFIKQCSICYIINDIMGLILVRKMPITTVIHHSITSTLGAFTLLKTSSETNIVDLAVMYAIFSSMAFSVNFYLGYRVFSNNIWRKKILSITSFWVYLLTCIINWGIQSILITRLYKISPVQFGLYMIFLYSIIKDDIILMKWLYDDSRKLKIIEKRL